MECNDITDTPLLNPGNTNHGEHLAIPGDDDEAITQREIKTPAR